MMSETVVTVEPNKNNAQPKPTGGVAGAQQQQQQQQQQSTRTGGPLSWIKLNLGYFRTYPGICKLIQLLFGILCMALASPAYIAASHWFLFVVVTSFISTILWTFIYFLSIREVLNLAVNWILTELINYSIITIAYTIAFIVQLAVWSGLTPNGVNIAAGVFGLFNTLVYALSTYFLYLEQKTGSVQ